MKKLYKKERKLKKSKFDKLKPSGSIDQRTRKVIEQNRESDCVKFSINIPRKIHRKLKSVTASEGKDMKTIIMDNIVKYLEKYA